MDRFLTVFCYNIVDELGFGLNNSARLFYYLLILNFLTKAYALDKTAEINIKDPLEENHKVFMVRHITKQPIIKIIE